MTDLFHGTRRAFTRGGLVLPRTLHGGPGTSAPTLRAQPLDAAAWVYASEDETLAWVYAWHAPGAGRPRVLVVQPLGRIDSDPEHSAAALAVRCEALRVVKVLREPTITQAEALAGWVM